MPSPSMADHPLSVSHSGGRAGAAAPPRHNPFSARCCRLCRQQRAEREILKGLCPSNPPDCISPMSNKKPRPHIQIGTRQKPRGTTLVQPILDLRFTILDYSLVLPKIKKSKC